MAKSKYKVRKQINPKCPLCDRRVPYLLDSIVKGKRYVRCSVCDQKRVKEADYRVVRQLTLLEDGEPVSWVEETEPKE